jgi:hypothetical protein
MKRMPFFAELEVREYTPKDKSEQSEGEVITITRKQGCFEFPLPLGEG